MNIITGTIERLTNDGDIILLVGPSRKGIEVNSAILKKASPIFAAHLGNAPEDGHAFTIELPDDDFHVFLLVASILHDHGEVPELHELLDIVELVEKYKFDVNLSRFFAATIQKIYGLKDCAHLWKLLICAYKLDLDEFFLQTSKQLVLLIPELDEVNTFWELAQSTPSFEPSFKLAYALNHIKSQEMEFLSRILICGILDYAIHFECETAFDTLMKFKRMFRDTMDEEGIDSLRKHTLEEIYQIFKNCREQVIRSNYRGYDFPAQRCSCDVGSDQHRTIGDFCEFVRDRATRCENLMVGLSLQDFKDGTIRNWNL